MISRRTLLAQAAALPAAATLLAACAAAPPRPEFARVGFDHRVPLRFDVARVTFRDDSRAVREAPHVAHRFPDPPAEVVERWARQRLQAVGSSGELEVVLREASVTETQLPRTQGLRGMVTVDQSERYDARIVLSLRARRGDGQSMGGLEAQVEHSSTVPENISSLERERAWHRLTETLTRRLDEEVERSLRAGELALLLR